MWLGLGTLVLRNGIKLLRECKVETQLFKRTFLERIFLGCTFKTQITTDYKIQKPCLLIVGKNACHCLTLQHRLLESG